MDGWPSEYHWPGLARWPLGREGANDEEGGEKINGVAKWLQWHSGTVAVGGKEAIKERMQKVLGGGKVSEEFVKMAFKCFYSTQISQLIFWKTF